METAYKKAMDAVMLSGQRGIMPQSPGAIYGPGMDAGGTSTGLVFLAGELEKQDPRLLEPMTSLTAPRDIDMKPGGGWTSITSNVFVDYATSGSDEDSIIGSETNNIPVSQANISKDVFKVHTFSEILRVPLFDELKLQQIGKSLSTILDTGIRLQHSKMIDRNVYVGISKTGTYGLINNPLIVAANAALGASASRLWVNKTPTEIMNDINQLLTNTVIASGYDLSGMASRILIDWSNYGYIANTPVTIAGTQSILSYLLENNIATKQGRPLEIFPLQWCTGAGVGGTQRMMAYVKEESKVNIDLPVPLSRVMTAPNTTSGSYETIFASQFSQVKFLFYTCAAYTDGI
ncbi:major capsid family protein [Desulfosporosinus fructosivorans]|nr:major capsid family protein [Desulfosporosinus fructosivorans]